MVTDIATQSGYLHEEQQMLQAVEVRADGLQSLCRTPAIQAERSDVTVHSEEVPTP